MKKILAFGVLILLIQCLTKAYAQPLNGTYTINNTAATGGTNFQTITAAVNALNANGVAGAVTFNVSSGQTFDEVVPVLKATGTSSNTITFRKFGIGAKPVIRRSDAGSIAPTTRGGAGDALLVIEGGDYIIFDSLEFRSTHKGVEYGLLLKKELNNGCKNIIVRNSNFEMRADSSMYATAIYAANLGTDTTAASADGVAHSSAAGKHENITITGNSFTNVVHAMLLMGYGGNGTLYDQSFTIGGNTASGNNIHPVAGPLADTAYGVYAINHIAINISGNNFSHSSSTVVGKSVCGIYLGALEGPAVQVSNNVFADLKARGSVAGIIVAAGGGSVNIFKNKIYGLNSVSTTSQDFVRGVNIRNGSNIRIYNNLIGVFRADSLATTHGMSGIYSSSTQPGSSLGIYYNTIYLNAVTKSVNFGSSAVFAMGSNSSTTATLDLRNNILVNLSERRGLGVSVALHRSSTALGNYASSSDRNIYYAGVPGPSNLIYYDGTYALDRFTAFRLKVGQQSNSSRDLFSQTENPPMLSTTGSSNTFLHLGTGSPTFAEGGGSAIAGIADDFDGNARGGNSDIGADETNAQVKSKGMVVTDFSGLSQTGQALLDTIGVRLARKILGKGVTLVNCTTGLPTQRDYPKYTGTAESAGTFSNGIGAIDLDEGIVMTNGRAKTQGSLRGVDGPSSAGPSNSLNLPGDMWLDAYLSLLPNPSGTPRQTQDASILRFSFIPEGDVMEFNYVFTSEEYQTYTCTQFTDIFAFLLMSGSGVPGSPMDKNIAKVPGTTVPVAINTVNRGPSTAPQQTWCPAGNYFPQYYIDNSPGIPPTSLYLTHKGKTVVLKAVYKGLVPCTKYNILIGIADVSDRILDSGVFIEANSFKSNDYQVEALDGFKITDSSVTAVEGCKPAEITIRLKSPSTEEVRVNLTYSGSATKNVDYKTTGGLDVPETLIFAAGEIEKTITFIPTVDNIKEGLEKLVIRPKTYECRQAIANMSCGPLPPLPDSFVVFIQDTIKFNHKYRDTICTPPVTLNATQTPGFVTQTYSWNTTPVKTTPSIDVSDGGTYVVTHFYSFSSNNEGCINTDTFEIWDGRRTAKFKIVDSMVCEGDTVWIKPDTSVHSTEFYWNLGDGRLDTLYSTDSFMVVYPNPGMYVITDSIVSDLGCPTKIAIDTVYVYGKPRFGLITPSGCAPTSGLLNFADTSWIPDSTQQVISNWKWQFGDANATPANPNVSTVQNPSHIFKDGTYNMNLAVTSSKGCSRDTSFQTIVKITPALAFASLNPICYTDEEILVNKGSVTNGAPGTGVYKGPGITDAAAGKFKPSVAGAGLHTIWYVFDNSGCKDSISQTITVHALPSINTFTLPQACLNEAGLAQFNSAATVTNATIAGYRWWFGDSAATGSVSSNLQNPSHNVKEGPLKISLRVTSSHGCIKDTFETVTFKLTPALTTPTYTPVCADAMTDTLAAPVNTNSVAGTGVFAGGPYITPAGAFNPALASTVAMNNFTYKYTSANGCEKAVNLSRLVYPRAQANFNLTAVDICMGNNAVITPVVVAGNIQSWKWDFGNGAVETRTNGSQFSYKYDTTGSYMITLIAVSDKGCVGDPVNKTVSINPVPKADFMLTAPICFPGGSAIFSNLSTIADNSTPNWNWDFNDGTPNSTEKNPQHVYGTHKAYNVKLTATSAKGCSNSITKQISTTMKPTAGFELQPDTVCQGRPVRFIDASNANGSTIKRWRWTFGDGTSQDNSISKDEVKIYSGAGTYDVKLVVTNMDGCTGELEKTVKVYPQPKIDAGKSFVVSQGTVINFEPKLTGVTDTNSVKFEWTPRIPQLINPDSLRASLIVLADGTFTLTATTKEFGCSASDKLSVKMLKPIQIPNAFSPNGDGINDYWLIPGLEDYPGHQVEVFNRQGISVYSTTNYKTPWNGTYNGQPLPVGVYYYIIEPRNGYKPISGYITILR